MHFSLKCLTFIWCKQLHRHGVSWTATLFETNITLDMKSGYMQNACLAIRFIAI